MMPHKLQTSTGGRVFVLTIMAFLSFTLTTLMLRIGIKSVCDSWYAWEGSVNLAEHGSYMSMLGEPIHDWPPLFSIYLLAFEQCFSQTGRVLILAMCVLVAVNTVVWGAYVFKIFPEANTALSMTGLVGSLAFLVCFLPLTATWLLSNCLLLIFVGLVLNALPGVTENPGWRRFVPLALAVGFCLATGIFIHNSAIVYVAASAGVIFLTPGLSMYRRGIVIALILMVTSVAWISVPHGLTAKQSLLDTAASHAPPMVSTTGQQGSHQLFHSRYTLGEYVTQVPIGIGVFFVSSPLLVVQGAVGLAVLISAVFLVARKSETKLESRHRMFLEFVLLALLCHFIIFNLVWIDSAIGGRFDWYFAAAIVPIILCRLGKSWAILTILLVLTVGVSGWRLGKLVWNGDVPALASGITEVRDDVIRPEFFCTSLPDAIVPPNAVRVVPPVYPWDPLPAGVPASRLYMVILLPPSKGNQP